MTVFQNFFFQIGLFVEGYLKYTIPMRFECSGGRGGPFMAGFKVFYEIGAQSVEEGGWIWKFRFKGSLPFALKLKSR